MTRAKQAVLFGLLLATSGPGCTRYCQRYCGNQCTPVQPTACTPVACQPQPAMAAGTCPPGCTPVAPVPAAPTCPPGCTPVGYPTANGYPATSWQRPVPGSS